MIYVIKIVCFQLDTENRANLSTAVLRSISRFTRHVT